MLLWMSMFLVGCQKPHDVQDLGAGRTDMIFPSVDQVIEEDMSDCYSWCFAELLATHGEFILDEAVTMVVLLEEG